MIVALVAERFHSAKTCFSSFFFSFSRENHLRCMLRKSVSKMSTIVNEQKNCVFCKILKKEEPGVSIYEDDDVSCIKDINPASTHHYLIIPKNHIVNAKTMKKEHEALYDKMVATVDTIIDQLGLEKNSTRTGFHWPPFTTVNHLHLHVISPVETMSYTKDLMFKPNSLWFVSTDYVKSRFKAMNS